MNITKIREALYDALCIATHHVANFPELKEAIVTAIAELDASAGETDDITDRVLQFFSLDRDFVIEECIQAILDITKNEGADDGDQQYLVRAGRSEAIRACRALKSAPAVEGEKNGT